MSNNFDDEFVPEFDHADFDFVVDDVESGPDRGANWDEVPEEDQHKQTHSNTISYNQNQIQLANTNKSNNQDNLDKIKLNKYSNVYKWTSTDVINFITSLNSEYVKYETKLSIVFAKQNVKGSSLFLMREHHLEYFGISDYDDRSMIFSQIQQLIEKEKEICKKTTLSDRFFKAFDESMEIISLQKDKLNFIKQYNPLVYLPQISKILYSTRRMKSGIDHIGYPSGTYVKYQNFLNYFLYYYNYIHFVNALYVLMVMYLNLFLRYFCNFAFQYFNFSIGISYGMDYPIIPVSKISVLLVDNLTIKLQDYGVTSHDKWIFRKHGFYSDYWCCWMCYFISNGIKTPQDVFRITGVKSSWLENSGWIKLLIRLLDGLMFFAVFLCNQCDFWLGMDIIRLNCLISRLISSILFVFRYLVSVSYILCFTILITLISGIKCGYMISLFVISIILSVFCGINLWVGEIVLECHALFYFYNCAGPIFLARQGHHFGLGHDRIHFYFSCYVRFRMYYWTWY